jgi:hypothetical protein
LILPVAVAAYTAANVPSCHMVFLADLVVRDRPELTLPGGGRIVADLVTAALGAKLEVPPPLTARAAGAEISPDELTWLRSTAADLTNLGSTVDGLDRLTSFLDGTAGGAVDVVAQPVTLTGWLTEAMRYYRALGYFTGDAAPDLPALEAAWAALGAQPAEALARGGEHLPDATLLRADLAHVLDGELGASPFSEACLRVLHRLAAVGRGRFTLTLDGCEAWPDPRPRPAEHRALFGEDFVKLRFSVDGTPTSATLPFITADTFHLAPLLAELNRALLPSGIACVIVRHPTIVLVLPLAQLAQLRRERGVAMWNPEELLG